MSFPLSLDMAPYTRQSAQESRSTSWPHTAAAANDGTAHNDAMIYNLRGVIVHKGEASHGHYYCFMHKRDKGWFRVDDETISPFDLENGLVDKPTQQFVGPALAPVGPPSGGGKSAAGLEGLTALAEECFGGVDAKSKRAGKKPRNNNAFVLFYERAPDKHLHTGNLNPLLDDSVSTSSPSSDASRSPFDGTAADPGVKELQTALQSLPDDRHYGTHPELEEVGERARRWSVCACSAWRCGRVLICFLVCAHLSLEPVVLCVGRWSLAGAGYKSPEHVPRDPLRPFLLRAGARLHRGAAAVCRRVR